MTDIRDLIGVPYRPHGRGMDGMDCYGLAIEVLRRNGIELADVFYESTDTGSNLRTAEVIRRGLPLERLERPEELCLVDIAMSGGGTSHVGVYIGGGMFVHSMRDVGVCVQSVARYSGRIRGYYRVSGYDS